VTVVGAVTAVPVLFCRSLLKEPLEIAEFTAFPISSNVLGDAMLYLICTPAASIERRALCVAVILVIITALLLTPTVFATVTMNPALNAGVAAVVTLILPRLYG
jgi:hypothetical protein